MSRVKNLTIDGSEHLMAWDRETGTTTFDVFKKLIETESDINMHLLTLHLLAKDCNHVTEMGSRWGHSTFSIIASGVPKFLAYDLEINSNIEIDLEMARLEGVDF
jgi:hypothetical protein